MAAADGLDGRHRYIAARVSGRGSGVPAALPRPCRAPADRPPPAPCPTPPLQLAESFEGVTPEAAEAAVA